MCCRLHSERPSRAAFSASRACRLTFAELPGERGGAFVVFNALEFLHITEYSNPDRVSQHEYPGVYGKKYLSPESCCMKREVSPNATPSSSLFSQLMCVCVSSTQEPVRSIYCGTSGAGPNTWPTCHTHAPAPDDVDLLIGLNTGDGALCAVRRPDCAG